jgi:hypothetical protein
MKRQSMYEILEQVSKCKTPAEKVEVLRRNDNGALRTVLKYALDPQIKFALPKGDPPFKPCPYVDQEARLYTEVRRLYLFLEGGNPNLTNIKREMLYIQLIESIDPKDAKLVNCMKDKKLPFKGITAKIINEAFPDLIPVKESQKA